MLFKKNAFLQSESILVLGFGETHWLFGKEKVPGAVASKEGDSDSLLGSESTHHYYYMYEHF